MVFTSEIAYWVWTTMYFVVPFFVFDEEVT